MEPLDLPKPKKPRKTYAELLHERDRAEEAGIAIFLSILSILAGVMNYFLYFS